MEENEKYIQRQIVSFTLLTKVFFVVKSWRGAITGFRKFTK